MLGVLKGTLKHNSGRVIMKVDGRPGFEIVFIRGESAGKAATKGSFAPDTESVMLVRGLRPMLGAATGSGVGGSSGKVSGTGEGIGRRMGVKGRRVRCRARCGK